MSLSQVHEGDNLPHEVNVIIEIPTNSSAVKYEVDKDSGVLFVDRFMSTPMYYPANYGYVPNTLSEDGDPVDVLVLTPTPLLGASVIAVRLVGMLKMTDESGVDAKLLAVPIDKVSRSYREIQSYKQLSPNILDTISHFFEHYKDLDEGKWVKIEGWADADEARDELMASVARYKAS